MPKITNSIERCILLQIINATCINENNLIILKYLKLFW